MPRRLYIPREVRAAIAAHIEAATARAVDGFLSAHEDEDTLTGELGSSLRTGTHTVNVVGDEINGPWKWSIRYSKFRGRGFEATESLLGADGIFELTLNYGMREDTKSLLFQAKTEWQKDTTLISQAAQLSTWREAAIFVNYTPQGFYAYSIDSVLGSRGAEADAENRLTLQEALTEHFLDCRIGDMDLRYNPATRHLTWRDLSGAIVATKFSIPNRIRVKIQSPNAKEKVNFEKLIPFEDIHRHRMQAEPEEMLMPLLSENNVSPKNQKRSLSMTYHPDRYSDGDQLLRDLLNRRMQEINAAYETLEAARRDNIGESEQQDDGGSHHGGPGA
jgi:hypothetical protein